MSRQSKIHAFNFVTVADNSIQTTVLVKRVNESGKTTRRIYHNVSKDSFLRLDFLFNGIYNDTEIHVYQDMMTAHVRVRK